jgi:hypothetical protein
MERDADLSDVQRIITLTACVLSRREQAAGQQKSLFLCFQISQLLYQFCNVFRLES